MQQPAAAEAAQAARTAAAWDWLVDAAVEERKQAVHELAYKVRAKYFKNLDDDLKHTATESYKKIRPYTGGPPADPKDVVAEQNPRMDQGLVPARNRCSPIGKARTQAIHPAQNNTGAAKEKSSMLPGRQTTGLR